MIKRMEDKGLDKSILFSSIVLLIYTYFLVRDLIPNVWVELYSNYYIFIVPVFIAVTLYLRRFNEFLEIRLIIFFAIWVYITRLLNGDYFLSQEWDIVLNSSTIYVFLLPCIVLKGKAREIFLDLFSIITSGYYTLIALIGLYSVLLHRELFNPFTGNSWSYFIDARIYLFSKNPNICCMWFFIAFFLLVYLYIRKKNPLWRAVIIPTALLNYVLLAMTYSRSAMLAFSLGIGLLGAIFVMSKFPMNKLDKKIIITVATLCILSPACYLSFNSTARVINNISNSLVERFPIEETTEIATASTLTSFHSISNSPNNQAENAAVPLTANTSSQVENLINRGFDDSGRLEIYKSIIPTMQQDPLRLLRGCLCLDVMEISNTVLPKPKPHMHNTFLQLLCLTGLPGFILTLLFCLLIAYHILRLFFSETERSTKVLLLILIGTFLYNQFEVALFVATDIRSLAVYIIAGAVLAYSYELKPPPKIPLLRKKT